MPQGFCATFRVDLKSKRKLLVEELGVKGFQSFGANLVVGAEADLSTLGENETPWKTGKSVIGQMKLFQENKHCLKGVKQFEIRNGFSQHLQVRNRSSIGSLGNRVNLRPRIVS